MDNQADDGKKTVMQSNLNPLEHKTQEEATESKETRLQQQKPPELTDLKTINENLSGVKVADKEDDLEAPTTPNLKKNYSAL